MTAFTYTPEPKPNTEPKTYTNLIFFSVSAAEVQQIRHVYILNKSENATPELFAIYIQNYANQICNGKCILMFKYLVMHNSKSFTDVVTMKHVIAI